MTATNDAAAIAVLQNQQKQLENSVDAIGRQMAEGFAQLNVKVDRFAEHGRDIVRLQERERQHTEAMARAFDAISGFKDLVAQCRREHADTAHELRTDIDADLTAYEKRIADLEKDGAHNAGLIKGAWIVGGVLYALVVAVGGWFANDVYETVRANSSRITTLEATK